MSCPHLLSFPSWQCLLPTWPAAEVCLLACQSTQASVTCSTVTHRVLTSLPRPESHVVLTDTSIPPMCESLVSYTECFTHCMMSMTHVMDVSRDVGHLQWRVFMLSIIATSALAFTFVSFPIQVNEVAIVDTWCFQQIGHNWKVYRVCQPAFDFEWKNKPRGYKKGQMAPPNLKVGHRIGTEAESGKKKGKREISMHKYFCVKRLLMWLPARELEESKMWRGGGKSQDKNWWQD